MTTAIYLQNGLCPQNRRVEQHKSSSVAALAPDWRTPFVAFVDGKAILRADWELVLDDQQVVAFIDADAIPQGGGGGGSNPLRTVLMIAVMVYAPQIAAQLSYSMGGGMVLGSVGGLAAMQAGVMLVGMSLVNAIAPPPKPTSAQQAASLAAASPTYSLQAQGNSARLEAAIPEHFGRSICYPDFAAQPYAEYSGNEQYLYQLLCVGRGEYDLEPIKIEDTPLTNFAEVTTEVVAPYGRLTLFPASVTTSIEVSGQTLSTLVVGPFVANAAGTQVNRLAFDFVAPRGMYYANDDGSLAERSVFITIDVAQVDDAGTIIGGWTALATAVEFSAATTTAQRWSLAYDVPEGRYTARVRRTEDESEASREVNGVSWTGMRAYHPDAPGKHYGDVTLIAVKMRASDNLSAQASRKINVVATRKLPIWNGTTWSELTATRSPAWAIAYACKQVGRIDGQIDLAGLSSLAATCAARGDTFDGRFDSFLGFWEAVSKIAGAVRAKPYMQGGVFRVARDQPSTIPVAMFTQRNIVKGSFSVTYLMPTPDTADSVDVSYFSDITWKSARVRSTLDGSTADRPAKIDLFGVVSRAQAHREGLYQAACNRYRRKIITFQTEMEGFIPSLGDLIVVQHDMPAWGQSGEVVSWNAATKIMRLSEPPIFSAGSHYIALRKRDGTVDGPYLCTMSGENEVTLSSAPAFLPYTGGNAERTHYAFGSATNWRQPARVLSAKPQGESLVTIECVNEDDSVHTADVGVTLPPQKFSQLDGFKNAPAVSGLTARFMFNYPNMAVASWAPTPWADHYAVEQSGDGATWTSCGTVTATSASFAAAYGSNTRVRVAAIAVAKGPWLETDVIVVPPFDPTGLAYSQELGGLRIKWDARLEINFYELRVGGASWGAASLLAPVTGTEYLWPPQSAGTYAIWLKSVDVNGNYSAGATSLSVVITGSSAPEVSYAISGPDEIIDWAIPKSGFTVDRYEIRKGASWAAGTFVSSPKSTSHRQKVDYAGAQTYWVAAVDVVGNYGAPGGITAMITEPGQVTAFRADVVDNNALLYWGAPSTGSLPVDRYEVRRGTSWAAGTPIGSNGNSTFFTVFEQQADTYIYWVSAVDTAGNFGAAVSVTANIDQPPDYVLRVNRDSTFSGPKVNALLTDAYMLVPVNTTETWQQHFVNNGYSTPQDQISAGNSLYIEPSTTTASYTEDIDYGSTLPATNIVATINSTALDGSVSVSCQIRYKLLSGDAWTDATPGATSCLAVNFRYVQVVYTFTATAGANLLRVNSINIKLSIKNRSDSGAGISASSLTTQSGVSAYWTWVPFGYQFIGADCPVVQANSATPLIPIVSYVGVVNPTGFYVAFVSTSGTNVAGVPFSWSVKGY